MVKESDATSNRYADPVSFFYSDRGASFGFSEGTSITILLKDYDEYFLRRRDASASLWDLQNYTCQYCGRIAEHIDHVIPLSKGGSCKYDNLVLSCKRCNLMKGDATPDEAKMPLVRDFPETDEKWTGLSEQYFKPSIISTKVVYVKPNINKRYYEITLLDRITGEIISEHLAETKSEAFWKFIELYEGLNPNYTFNSLSRDDSAVRDGRAVALQVEEEELKSDVEFLKIKLKQHLKIPPQSYPVIDVYSALIREIAFSEKSNPNVFCCSICKQSSVLLADISFYFYTKSRLEHFDRLDTVICTSCSTVFEKKQKVRMGEYWADIVIGNKWHTLESFVKKRIGILRGNYIGNIGYWLEKSLQLPLDSLAEYIFLLDLCWSRGFKVSPWRPRYRFNIVEVVNALIEIKRE